MVIATEARHELFASGLHSRGFNVEPVIDRGQLKQLDAHQTLEKIMLGDMPDWDRFSDTIGDVIDETRTSIHPGPVRA